MSKHFRVYLKVRNTETQKLITPHFNQQASGMGPTDQRTLELAPPSWFRIEELHMHRARVPTNNIQIKRT